jgi:hypothetical protein
VSVSRRVRALLYQFALTTKRLGKTVHSLIIFLKKLPLSETTAPSAVASVPGETSEHHPAPTPLPEMEILIKSRVEEISSTNLEMPPGWSFRRNKPTGVQEPLSEPH